jgi:hypothetical protein
MAGTFDMPNDSPIQRSSGPRAERRRSERRNAYVPLFVYGQGDREEPFHERAYSRVVNERGALLVMTTSVLPGTQLLLVNQSTQLQQECRVVRVGHRNGPSIEVAIELATPSSDLWRLLARSQRASFTVPIDSWRKAL